jgi:hypothetical protein
MARTAKTPSFAREKLRPPKPPPPRLDTLTNDKELKDKFAEELEKWRH